jgi:hypothetical protein
MTTTKRTIELVLATSSALLCAHPAMAAASSPVAFVHVAIQAQASASSKLLGTVSGVSGNTLTVKTDAGTPVTVTVTDSTRLLRTQPGQKTLTGAQKIAITDLAAGDRILVMLTPSADGSPAVAGTVVAMSQSDIADKQKAEQADWQKRGVGGLVKSIDPVAGTITLTSGTRTVTIRIISSTTIRRYAPESVRYSDAKPSTLDQIHAGDELTARGDRIADGTEVAAEEIIAGTFRNIAGTVISIDAATGTIAVKDLLTKKQVNVRVTTDSQLKKLDPNVAQIIATRLKNVSGGTAPATANTSQGEGQRPARQGGPGGGSGGDLGRAMQRAAVIQISDLHKGDAIMIVATDGNPDAATAVTLLAGVEPMLEASASASQSMLSASWSLNGGGGGDQGNSQ